MKIFIGSIAIVFAIGAIIWIIGYLLPEHRSIQKEYQFRSSSEQVWKKIRDISNQTNWRTDIRSVEWIEKEPEIWKETAKTGNQIVFRTKTTKEQELWEMEILEPKGLEGGWIGKLQSNENGCLVTFRESIRIQNPIQRIFSYLFFDMNQTMNLYIQDLSRSLQEEYHEETIRTNMD